jgi:nucleoside 2-deoxyribosyltransferase
MPKVYLAGPITGLSYDQGQDWRVKATEKLADFGVAGLSPLRAKEFLRQCGMLSGTGEEYAHLGVLATPRCVMTRDRFDATRCDVLLVNLIGATRVSIGTVMEIAWADLARIPIVVAIEPAGNPHEHMMVNEAIGFRLPSLDEALTVVGAILGYDRPKAPAVTINVGDIISGGHDRAPIRSGPASRAAA